MNDHLFFVLFQADGARVLLVHINFQLCGLNSSYQEVGQFGLGELPKNQENSTIMI